jgi:hypothetical protein
VGGDANDAGHLARNDPVPSSRHAGRQPPSPDRDETVKVQARNRTMLAWLLFAATFACLAAGLALVRPSTVGCSPGARWPRCRISASPSSG